MDEQKAKRLVIIRWVMIAISAFIAMLFIEKPYEMQEAKQVLGSLSNCFVVPGVIFTGIGGLTFIASRGGYDSFGYMISNFSLHSLIPGSHPKKYKSFYDYKQEKDDKGRKWLPHSLFTGLVNLVFGILLLIFYAIV